MAAPLPTGAGCSPSLLWLPQIPVDEWGRLVVLGEGSTATVYLAKLQGHYVALKVRFRAAPATGVGIWRGATPPRGPSNAAARGHRLTAHCRLARICP